jgi:hypothetical protein
MGRRPVGKQPMTDAERQRKHRQALADKATANWKPRWTQDSGRRRFTEERFLELLDRWFEEGDPEEIAAYLADRMVCLKKWERITERVPGLMAKAEAMADEKRRMEWVRDLACVASSTTKKNPNKHCHENGPMPDPAEFGTEREYT